MPEANASHPHGVEIARHLTEIEELAGFPIAVVALESWEQLRRKISHAEVFVEQFTHIIDGLKDLHQFGRVFAEQQTGEGQ